MEAPSKPHLVLVHGACHGAWSWFKVIPKLTDAGIRVTAFDLAASGIDERKLDELSGLEDNTKPLLDFMSSLPSDERVILVGHSFGGINIALAMEKFSHKIAAGVFLAAFMPDAKNPPIYIMEKFKPSDLDAYWLDTVFGATVKEPFTSMFFGPKFMKKLYSLSSPEDYTVGTKLIRPGSLYLEDISRLPPYSKAGYGSVKKVYIICGKDEGIVRSYQQWLIENNPVDEVKIIEDSDHMAMLSKPKELTQYLLEIANKYDSNHMEK